MFSLININKYNWYGYFLAFQDDVLDETASLELFKFLLNTGYINGMQKNIQDTAMVLIDENYLTFDGENFNINKNKLNLN